MQRGVCSGGETILNKGRMIRLGAKLLARQYARCTKHVELVLGRCVSGGAFGKLVVRRLLRKSIDANSQFNNHKMF